MRSERAGVEDGVAGRVGPPGDTGGDETQRDQDGGGGAAHLPPYRRVDRLDLSRH